MQICYLLTIPQAKILEEYLKLNVFYFHQGYKDSHWPEEEKPAGNQVEFQLPNKKKLKKEQQKTNRFFS